MEIEKYTIPEDVLLQINEHLQEKKLYFLGLVAWNCINQEDVFYYLILSLTNFFFNRFYDKVFNVKTLLTEYSLRDSKYKNILPETININISLGIDLINNIIYIINL